jgi:hypothetical protein
MHQRSVPAKAVTAADAEPLAASKKMKKIILIISILIFWSNIVLAQKNIWIDSILNKVILNEIETFNTEFKPIKNHKIGFIKTDTLCIWQWTRPKFVNNIFQPPFSGSLIRGKIKLDTLTNELDNNYLNFISQEFDRNGYYLKDTIVFLVNKRNLKNDDLKQENELVKNLKNTTWKNDRIELNGKKIELDSCHNIFRLQLNEDFTFAQFFGNNQINCATQEMEKGKEINVDNEKDFFLKYYHKIQEHYINLQEGIWQIKDKEFNLINVNRKKIISFKIEELNDEELHLKLNESNYKIEMKKASR